MIKLSNDEKKALHCNSGARYETYSIELLNGKGVKKCDLRLVDGSITYNSDVPIKKAGSISFKEDTRVDFINDKLRVNMNIKINNRFKSYSLGIFVVSTPKSKNGIVSCQIFDETFIVDSGRIIEPKVFIKGTLYTDILQYFIISCGLIKVNIEPSTLIIQTDMVFDDSKSKLEWFNYVAEQINYTQLTVDEGGWFISKKYVEPSPANVDYVYADDDLSVMCGEPDVVLNTYRIPNIFKRIVAHPDLGEIVSVYINKDPSDKFSVVNTYETYDRKVIDNVANKVELDNITRKAAFKAKQATQSVTFETLNMPFHKDNMILDLRNKKLKGIFVESSFNIRLKAGSKMKHVCKRLIPLE